MSAKILLARKLHNETRAHSILVGDTGFYWRDLPAEAELVAELRGERFSLIIVDHRDVANDPLAFVESLRRWQKDTPVLVVSEELALENVIRAIRVGVKDLFHHPIDLRAMVERIYTTLKPELGSSRSAKLDEWSELMMQLTDPDAAPPVNGSRAGFGSASPLPAPGEADELARELKKTREAMTQAKSRQTELEQEVNRLRTAKPVMVAPQKAAIDPKIEEELAAAREQIETEQLLLTQQRKKFEAEVIARKSAESNTSAGLIDLTKRESMLAEKTREFIANQEKLRAEMALLTDTKTQLEEERAATDEIRAAQKDTEAKLKQLVIEQVALTKAKEKHERDCTVWQQVRVKAEAELARREEAMAQAQSEAAHLAVEQEKFEAAQLLLTQATAKLEAERVAWTKQQAGHLEAVAKMTAKEAELVQARKALLAKEAAYNEGVEHLKADQEKWESERLVALQVQAKFAKDRAALDKIAAGQQAEMDQIKAQREALAAEQRKAADELAGREEQLEKALKDLAPMRAELEVAQQKIEAEVLLAKQNVAKAAAARNEAETLREELQHQTKMLAEKETALAEKEAALEEAEVVVQNQLEKATVQKAELEQERANQRAAKLAMEQETAALAERVWMFESKQQQIKEQMKQLLAAS